MLLALAVGLVLGGVSSAEGAPRPTVEDIQKRVVQLQKDAEIATEQYHDAREQLRSVTVRVEAAKIRLARQRTEVARAKEQLGQLAAETYRRGQYSTLAWMLRDDPTAAMVRSGILPSLGSRQAGALRRLAEGERRLVAMEADLAAQQRRLQETDIRMRLHKNAVQQRLAEAQAALNTLQASERARVVTAARTPGDAGPGGTLACNSMAVKAPDARVKAVLEFACAQVGDPYVWAGEGPDVWDCSGLTMLAWRQAGVSLPHSSRMQATYGDRVLLNNLRPGDLVFFYSPISHMGIYLGGGMMVHAPRSGDVVKVARLFQTPSAAVRL
jgi:cell wall-associated NlpC family hydrolase